MRDALTPAVILTRLRLIYLINMDGYSGGP